MMRFMRRLALGFCRRQDGTAAVEFVMAVPVLIMIGRETVAQGIAAAPDAFLGLLKGKNFGKQLVKLV